MKTNTQKFSHVRLVFGPEGAPNSSLAEKELNDFASESVVNLIGAYHRDYEDDKSKKDEIASTITDIMFESDALLGVEYPVINISDKHYVFSLVDQVERRVDGYTGDLEDSTVWEERIGREVVRPLVFAEVESFRDTEELKVA